MSMDRPERPQGRHVIVLRTHLRLNQTRFGALIDLNQPEVSTWEAPRNREVFLPDDGLAERFLEVWDCFSKRPAGGFDFDEMMATLAAYRGAHAASAPPALDTGRRVVRLVPGEPGLVDAPELYWVPGDQSPPEDEAPEPSAAGPIPEPRASKPPEYEREVLQFRLALSSVWILVSLWSRAKGRQRAPAVRVPGRWATAVAVALVVFPMGCLHVGQRMAQQEPDAVPGQVYTDNGNADTEADMGDKTQGSIPMPKKPYAWQKVAPCGRGEVEKRTGCWIPSVIPPPCPRAAVEDEGTCYVPVPAEPKSPSAITPQK